MKTFKKFIDEGRIVKTIVNLSQLTMNSYPPPGYNVDASDIGLRPGQWPDMIQIREPHIGNGQVFTMISKKPEFVIYKQQNGELYLKVYND